MSFHRQLLGLLHLVVAAQFALAQFPIRGLKTDLANSADKFLPLDLNGDGKTDMLYYRPGYGYAGVYLSHGDGTFRYVAYADNGTSKGGFTGDMTSPEDTFVALDLNGDGKTDFIEYRPGSGYAFACLSVGDGSVSCTTWSSPSGQITNMKDNFLNGSEHIVALDLNGDGLSDFIVYSPGHSTARAYIYNANGSLSEHDLTNNAASGFTGDLSDSRDTFVALDLNGDHKTDFIDYRPGGGYAIECLSIGDGTVHCAFMSQAGKTSLGIADDFLNGAERIVPLDMNGDGRSDFVLYTPGTGWTSAYISTAGTACTASVNCPLVTVRRVLYSQSGSDLLGFQDNMQNPNTRIVVLDLNGDGKSDLLVYTPGGGTARGYLSGGPLALSSSASDQLTEITYRDGSTYSDGFLNDVANTADTAMPMNFLGTPVGSGGSGFFWYRPGSGLNGTFAYAADSSGKLTPYSYCMNTATWMNDLYFGIANVPLKSVVMPGTHDSSMSMAYGGSGPADFAITQSEDLGGQFADGARVYDFRFSYLISPNKSYQEDLNGNVYAHLTGDLSASYVAGDFFMYGHNNFATNVTTGAALAKIRDYLTENPNEIVVLIVDEDIKGKLGDSTSQFVNLMESTFPSSGVQVYSPLAACKATNCSDPNVQPQNMTQAQLVKLNQRLILIDQNDPYPQLSPTGWAWDQANTNDYAGYADWTPPGVKEVAGAETEEDELAISEVSTNGMGGVQEFRPYFLPANAAPHFLELNTSATPYSFFDLGTDLAFQAVSPYDNATCNPSGFPLACLYGATNDNDYFAQWLGLGRWQANALNFWLMDAIQPNSDPFVGDILSRNDEAWINAEFFNSTFPQPAGAIGVGANGDVWASGAPGGHAISLYKYNAGADGAAGTWTAAISSQPNVKKIAVTPTGGVFWINASPGSAAGILHESRDGLIASTGYTAQDVAVGGDQSVWILEAPGTAGNGNASDGALTRIAGPGNSQVPANLGGAGISIAVDGAGAPWVVNASGQIYRANIPLKEWQQLPPIPATQTILETGNGRISGDTPLVASSQSWQANSISVGADGSVFVTATAAGSLTVKAWGIYGEYKYPTPSSLPVNSLWRWDPSNSAWVPVRMDAKAVAVDAGGHPWVIRPDGSVYLGALDHT